METDVTLQISKFELSNVDICTLSNMKKKGSNFELFTKVWAHKTSLAPPLFIEAPVPSQEVSGHVFV